MNNIITVSLAVLINVATGSHFLPRPVGRFRLPIRHGEHDMSLLQTQDYHDREMYENSQYRKFAKEDLPLLLFKEPNKQKFTGPWRYVTKLRPMRSAVDPKYDKLFNKNGMLFLTKRIEDSDRQLNSLMNKVVKYEMDKKNRYLRKPLTKVFKEDELARLKKIVRALNSEKEAVATPRTVYEFSELVV